MQQFLNIQHPERLVRNPVMMSLTRNAGYFVNKMPDQSTLILYMFHFVNKIVTYFLHQSFSHHLLEKYHSLVVTDKSLPRNFLTMTKILALDVEIKIYFKFHLPDSQKNIFIINTEEFHDGQRSSRKHT